MDTRSKRIMATPTAGAIFSAGCEQSFVDRARVSGADVIGSTQAAEPVSAETAQLVTQSVGGFVAGAPTSSGKVALTSFLRITPALASFRLSAF